VVLFVVMLDDGRGGERFTWNTVRLYHVDGDRIAEVWLMIGDQYAFDAWLAD